AGRPGGAARPLAAGGVRGCPQPPTPPGPEVAGRVALDGEAADGGLGLEPGPGRAVLLGPGEPGPAAGRVAADRGQPLEAGLEPLPQPVPAHAHAVLPDAAHADAGRSRAS